MCRFAEDMSLQTHSTLYAMLYLLFFLLYALSRYIKNLPDDFSREDRLEFGHILGEILLMYTMHNLPHRAQVLTTF